MKNMCFVISISVLAGLNISSGYCMNPSTRQETKLTTATTTSEIGMGAPATKKKKAETEETPQIDFCENEKYPLHSASRKGDLKTVEKLLLLKQFPINFSDNYGMAPIHWAAWTGSHEVVEILLKAGANFNQPCRANGMTPLHLAACYKHTAVIKLLLHAGANVQITDCYGRTPFDFSLPQ